MSAFGELPGFASVSDANVCNWFFAMFAFISVYMGFILLTNVLRVGFNKIVPVWVKVLVLVVSLAATGVVIANAGFQFTMCKRALSV
jgi:hypothetical protein